MGFYESSQKVLVSTFDNYHCLNGSADCFHSGLSCCAIYLLIFKEVIFSRRSKTFIKVLGINIAIFGILLFSPAIIYRMFMKVKPRFAQLTNQTNDQRAYYPTYENKQFSIELFNELKKLPTNYRSFLLDGKGKK